MPGLVDRSSKPLSCAHQMPAGVEARIVELRRAHSTWTRSRRPSGHRGESGGGPIGRRASMSAVYLFDLRIEPLDSSEAESHELRARHLAPAESCKLLRHVREGRTHERGRGGEWLARRWAAARTRSTVARTMRSSSTSSGVARKFHWLRR